MEIKVGSKKFNISKLFLIEHHILIMIFRLYVVNELNSLIIFHIYELLVVSLIIIFFVIDLQNNCLNETSKLPFIWLFLKIDVFATGAHEVL